MTSKSVFAGAVVTTTIIAVAVICSGCAHAPVAAVQPPTAPCQTAPQWIVNDAAGKPTQGVYICFGAHGDLLYTTRPLTPEQVAAAEAPPPPNLPSYFDLVDLCGRKPKNMNELKLKNWLCLTAKKVAK